MKRKIINAMILLCMIGVSAKVFAEDNSLRISKVEIAQGTSSVTVPIYLDNSVSMCGFEVFIELPEGITLKHEYDEDEEEYVWGITKGGRLRTEHGVNCAVDNNGYIHLLCADLVTNKNFYDSDSKKGLPLVTLDLNVDPSMEIGSYEVILHDILLNHNENPTIVEYTPDDVACPFYVKPTSGVYTNLHDGILKVLTGIGEEISATDLVEAISSYQNVTCIDVTGTDLDAKYSISDIMDTNICNNVLVIVGEDDQLNGNNIIYKGECANLILTDGYDFAAPKAFTATAASYERALAAEWGTLMLPYAVSSSDAVQYYTLSDVDLANGVLTFEETATVEANTPAVFKAVGTTLTANASNVEIPVCAGVVVGDEMNGLTLTGTLSKTTLNGLDPEAATGVYYIKDNKFWRGNGTLNIPAFRAYFDAAVAGAKMLSIGGDATGINGINADADTKVYTIDGKQMNNNVKSLPAGMYIVNDKKVIIKKQ